MFRKFINFVFGTKYDGVVDLTPVSVKQPNTNQVKSLKKPYAISKEGIEFLKNWEKCKLKAYLDGGGVWTIGWGTTGNVKKGMVITAEQAEKLLMDYLLEQDKVLNKILNVDLISQKQYDVISSFVYNIGISQFSTSSLLKLLREKNWEKAANQMIRRDSKGLYHGWIYDNGKKVEGLINRRKAEKELFLQGSQN